MDIRITQTQAKIGVETQNASINISNNGKTDFTISHTEPQIQMRSRQPQILIDQTKAREDEGFKGIATFAAENASRGRQAALQYIGKTAREGDSFAKLQNGGKPMIQAIKQDAYESHEYDVGLVPSHNPEFNLKRGEVAVQVIEGDVQTQYNNVPIETRYSPGKVSYYMLQKGGVNVQYIGSNVDTKV